MIHKILYLLIGLFFLGISACKSPRNEKPIVSVSILPQKYFTERIAGDLFEVNVLVPPGMNPSTCDLNIGQLKKLHDSRLCFTIGYLPFEITHLYPALKQQPDIQVINHSENLPLLTGSCSHLHHHTREEIPSVDPHIWLSPAYAGQIAQTIFNVLSATYPEKKALFESNYRQLATDIDSVTQKANRILNAKRNKSFLIYHPALTYLAADYDMEQIPIEEEGKEPNPAHLKKIIDTAREKEIPLVFIQSQFDSKNAETIARETGAQIIIIDPLSEDWLAEMNRLLDIFQANLK